MGAEAEQVGGEKIRKGRGRRGGSEQGVLGWGDVSSNNRRSRGIGCGVGYVHTIIA